MTSGKRRNPPPPNIKPRKQLEKLRGAANDDSRRPREPPKRGEIWFARLDPGEGHEQLSSRPVLIVSTNELNTGPSGLATILPLTTNMRPIPERIALEPPEGGLKRPSMIITEQVRTISHTRFEGSAWGRVSTKTMAQVEDALRLFLAL